METNNAGGGEILQYWGKTADYSGGLRYMDEAVMKQFLLLPYVKIGIFVLIIILMVLLILRVLRIKSPLRGKGVNNELDYLENVKKRDTKIIRANNFIRDITALVEHSPLAAPKGTKEYVEYNLERANIRIPGKSRVLKAEEFNAVIKLVQVCCAAVALLVGIFANVIIGVVILVAAIMFGNSLPMMYIRGIVKEKDSEIVENFADFYLMMHYVLIARSNTPLSGIMKSYDKTTSSEEMHRFIDVCIMNLETYGEYEGTTHIAERYREIAVVGKLMRLIRQANEGGDIVSELMGFRRELLQAKEYEIKRRMDKLVFKAQASFKLLMPVLVQAVVSAMMIYVGDLKSAGSLM